MHQQPAAALQGVHHLLGRPRLVLGERHVVVGRGGEREHRHVGVAVEEHFLHEGLAGEALHVAELGLGVQVVALGLGHELEALGREHVRRLPVLQGVHVVTLDVEDELPLGEGCVGRRRVEGSEPGHVVVAPGPAQRRVGLVEGQQRGGGAGGGRHEVAAAHAEAPGVDADLLDGPLVGQHAVRRQGAGREFPVGGGVQLDGQAGAFGIEAGIVVLAGHVRISVAGG